MRLTLVVLLCAAMFAVLTTGCGKKTTYSTPDGTVTFTEKGDKTEIIFEGEEGKIEIKGDKQTSTVTTEEGTSTIQFGEGVSEADIGIPLYAGAQVEQTGSWSQSGEEEGELEHVTLTTSDSIDKVKAFYQKKFPDAQSALDMTTEDGRMVQMILEKGETHKTVMIQRDKDADETTIVLQRGRFAR